jgi:hypothetical protein
LQLTLSAGVTSAAPEEPSDSLMERGQKALQTALQSGGDRTCVEQPPTEAAADDGVADAVGTAAENDSLEPADEAVAVS